jgi:hypothetical protein
MNAGEIFVILLDNIFIYGYDVRKCDFYDEHEDKWRI